MESVRVELLAKGLPLLRLGPRTRGRGGRSSSRCIAVGFCSFAATFSTLKGAYFRLRRAVQGSNSLHDPAILL